MNEALNYIDDFFRGNPGPMQKQEFEMRLKEDPAFAEEVAFYVATINVLKDDAKAERKERFRNFKSEDKAEDTSEATNVRPMRSSRKVWMYSAAASVLVLFIAGFLFFGDRSTPVEMADRYIKDSFNQLSVTMSGSRDELQTGLSFYNEGKLNEALAVFLRIEKEIGLNKIPVIDPKDSIVLQKSELIDARLRDSMPQSKVKEVDQPILSDLKKYIGIVYLRLGKYDKALDYFQQLWNIKGLYFNPGLFYQAITLLKRNQTGDSDHAKKLLEQVDQFNLAGSEEARKWLKKF